MKRSKNWRLGSDRGVWTGASANRMQRETCVGHSSLLHQVYKKHVRGHVLVSQADFVSSSCSSSEANWSPLRMSERSPSRGPSSSRSGTTCSSVRW